MTMQRMGERRPWRDSEKNTVPRSEERRMPPPSTPRRAQDSHTFAYLLAYHQKDAQAAP
jgi:hypothetical protein